MFFLQQQKGDDEDVFKIGVGKASVLCIKKKKKRKNASRLLKASENCIFGRRCRFTINHAHVARDKRRNRVVIDMHRQCAVR